jgi:hypothetical protein
VIYCVIPRGLESDLYDRLVAYYVDNPRVTVIIDRRTGPDRRRRRASTLVQREQRLTRDRRRRRVRGTFASTNVVDP